MHGHPEAMLVSLQAPIAAKPKTSAYICPMCPGVHSEKPSSCPKCGMALEPAMPAARNVTTVYTCPMHPEVEQSHPGSCPKCGMQLERKTTALQSPEPGESELQNMTRRLLVAVALGLPRAAASHAAHVVDPCGDVDTKPRFQVGTIRAVYTGCAVGRLALLPTRLAQPGVMESPW